LSVSPLPQNQLLCVEERIVDYKKGNVVKHPKADWGRGIVLEDSDGSTVKIGFEKAGVKTISLQYVQPVVVDTASVPDSEVKRIAEKSRVYIDEPFVDIIQDIKSKYPEHLVIIENGCYFEVLEQDAEYFSNMYDWKIYERQTDVPMTGFPENAKNVWIDLKNLHKPYVVVSQLPNPKRGKIQRTISEVFP
jgi:hypothetical protein